MKKTVIIILLLLASTVTAQKEINNSRNFQIFVYSCLDSLGTKNLVKYQEIRAITIITNPKGKIISYIIYFTSKETQLSKKEYKWLFNLLKKENYLEYVKIFYSDTELKLRKDFYLRITFHQKEKR